jgi:hypothetical protein
MEKSTLYNIIYVFVKTQTKTIRYSHRELSHLV